MSPEEFRRVRKAARMTQAEMASRLGVSRKTVVNWETGIHAVPEGALDTMTERGIAPTPEAAKPVTPASHPELYKPGPIKNGFTRTHKHPHWFARNTRVWYYLDQATVDAFQEMIAYPDDIEKMAWTPERAVSFLVNLDIPLETAKELANEAGFAVPIQRDPYLVAQQLFFREHPLATVDQFLDANPQFKPAQFEMAGEIDPALKEALDNAFKL